MKPWALNKTVSSIKRSYDSFMDQYGHTAIYRRYNVGEKSEYYKNNTGDSVDGPQWTYGDEPIKIRHDPMSVRGAVGNTVQTSKIYIKSEVKPKRGDVIIELDLENAGDPPSLYEIYSANHVEAFLILDVDTKRGFKGKIEFYLVQVEPHMGDY